MMEARAPNTLLWSLSLLMRLLPLIYILTRFLIPCCFFCRVVPENVQKKLARDAKLLKELKERRVKERKERVEKRKTLRANAEKYYKEYQNQQ